MVDAGELAITLQFSGGMELMFDQVKEMHISVAEQTLGELIAYIASALVKSKPELFALANKIRPGILVLVNETDWELCGKETYVLKNKDTVVFISTLHGG